MPKKAVTAFTIYVKPELLAALKARAVADGRSLSNFVVQCLCAHLIKTPRRQRRRANGITASAG